MTHLRKAMLEELQRRNLSAITTRIYLHSVEVRVNAPALRGPQEMCRSGATYGNDAWAVRASERALEDLRSGKPTPKGEGVRLDEYEKIVDLELAGLSLKSVLHRKIIKRRVKIETELNRRSQKPDCARGCGLTVDVLPNRVALGAWRRIG